MNCEWTKLTGGGTAIICGGRRRRPQCQVKGCTQPGERQCDWRVPHRRSGSCDRHLCAVHAVPGGNGTDFCPHHKAPAQGALNLEGAMR